MAPRCVYAWTPSPCTTWVGGCAPVPPCSLQAFFFWKVLLPCVRLWLVAGAAVRTRHLRNRAGPCQTQAHSHDLPLGCRERPLARPPANVFCCAHPCVAVAAPASADRPASSSAAARKRKGSGPCCWPRHIQTPTGQRSGTGSQTCIACRHCSAAQEESGSGGDGRRGCGGAARSKPREQVQAGGAGDWQGRARAGQLCRQRTGCRAHVVNA